MDATAAEIRMEHVPFVIRKINVLTGSKYPQVSTRIHSIDFSTRDEDGYTKLSEAIRDLNIGVLGKLGFNTEIMVVVIQHLQLTMLANHMQCQLISLIHLKPR